MLRWTYSAYHLTHWLYNPCVWTYRLFIWKPPINDLWRWYGLNLTACALSVRRQDLKCSCICKSFCLIAKVQKLSKNNSDPRCSSTVLILHLYSVIYSGTADDFMLKTPSCCRVSKVTTIVIAKLIPKLGDRRLVSSREDDPEYLLLLMMLY